MGGHAKQVWPQLCVLAAFFAEPIEAQLVPVLVLLTLSLSSLQRASMWRIELVVGRVCADVSGATA